MRIECMRFYRKTVSGSSDAIATTNQVGDSLDRKRHYCSLCLEVVQKLPVSQRHISRLQSYSLTTSTSTLADHLRVVHDVKLSKVR